MRQKSGIIIEFHVLPCGCVRYPKASQFAMRAILHSLLIDGCTSVNEPVPNSVAVIIATLRELLQEDAGRHEHPS